MEDKLEDLKGKTSILEVVKRLGLLVKDYHNTQAIKCLFHEDNNPSMVLMPTANRYACKSCPAKGDIFDLIQKVKNCDFKEAVTWLDPNFYGHPEKIINEPNEYLSSRGIKPQTIGRFRLSIEKYSGPMQNRVGWWCVAIPLPTGIKYRFINKKGGERYMHSAKTANCLFKTNLAEEIKNKVLILTEGEFDAMILWQETGYHCWSVATGVESYEKFIKEHLEEFKEFNKIYLGLDNDDPGEKMSNKLADILGKERCFRLKVPKELGKDWTDFFQVEKSQVDFDKLLKSSGHCAENLLSKFEKEIEEGSYKLNSGFATLDDSILGFRSGCTYCVGGLKKSGKSSFLMNMLDDMIAQGIKVGFINTELPYLTFTARFAAIHNNLPYTETESNPDYSREWLKTTEDSFFYAEKADITDINGSSLEKTKEVMKAWINKGAKVLVFDNLTTVANESTDKKAGWQILATWISQLIDFAREYKVVLFFVLHTKESLVFLETAEGIKKIMADKEYGKIFDETITVNRKPSSGDLYGGGGAKSQISGGVLLIWRPYQDLNLQTLHGMTQLILEDFRYGASRNQIQMEFIGEKLRFEEVNTKFVPKKYETPLEEANNYVKGMQEGFKAGQKSGYEQKKLDEWQK